MDYLTEEDMIKIKESVKFRSDGEANIVYRLCDQLIEALTTLNHIAARDDLLDANEEVFNDHAARRMQAQAAYVLEKYA